MQKIIRLETENTPLERWTENSACEIYSHDTNNGQFEIEVMNEALTDETVTALFIFEESQSVWRTTGTIEENKIKFKFDTTLITQDETVLCVLYLDNERENNDFYRFNFKVKVSEIDKLDNLTVKERFFKNNLIVDRLDVVTKTELQEILKTIDLSSISTDGLLTEEKANGLYAKISELEALSDRVTALENKQDNDTVYNDTPIKERLKALESKSNIDLTDYETFKNMVVTKGYLEKQKFLTEQYNDKPLTDRVIALENKTTTNQFEIHGTGMPNGVVTAEIGTTYVDTNNTNGALKWIKTTDGGNTGWKVFTGDTGWRTLPLRNNRDTSKLQIRRINDEIIVKFDGLSWGWFGVDDLQRQESSGYIVEKQISGKNYTWIKLDVGRGNDVLPEGFRSASSLLTGLYGDLGDLLGSVYVGGTSDSNAIQLRYAMSRNELTSNILSQIRISPITFVTDDDWPTQLP